MFAKLLILGISLLDVAAAQTTPKFTLKQAYNSTNFFDAFNFRDVSAMLL